MSDQDREASPFDELGRLPPHGLATYDLSPAQVRALGALVRGASVTDAAEEADVHRCTVHRWRRDDPDFQAALNALRQGLQERVVDQLLSVADQAADTVAEAVIEGDDVNSAFRLLRGLGLLDGTRPEHGATAPAVRRLDQAVSEQRLRRLLKYLGEREMTASEGSLLELFAEAVTAVREEEGSGNGEVRLAAELTERATEHGLMEKPSPERSAGQEDEQ